MSAVIPPDRILVENAQLFCPPLDEIVGVLNEGLLKNFATVSVKVEDCPDLTKEPFTLACSGLGGKPRLIEVGGVPYLLPLVKRNKLYDMRYFGLLAGMPDDAFLIGAGAGPWPYAQVNCEAIINLKLNNYANPIKNQTWIAKVIGVGDKCVTEQLPLEETRNALLGNIFCCEGKPGKVIKIDCKKRIGQDDFITSIRTTLNGHYKDRPIGMGGVFVLQEGKARQHVMRDFSLTPITSDEQLNNWLKFYNMSAPLIAVGTLVTVDPGLDLRVQHFHSFSHHNEAGHYHNDTTPDTVHYEAYLALAEQVYRFDRPEETHFFGRD